MPKPPKVLDFEYPVPLAPGGRRAAHHGSRDEAALSWWDGFSKGVIGISTFGASIAFSVIVSNLPDPAEVRALSSSAFTKKTHFSREEGREFLAIAWVMFVLALGFALVSQLLLRRSRGYGNG